MNQETTGGLKVANAWTQAGYKSCVRVTGRGKQEDMLFDCGSVNHECFPSKYIFITHGHLDHIGSAIPFARAKSLSFGTSVFYVPSSVAGPLTAAKEAYEQMSGEMIDMDIRTISPGDAPVRISDRLSVFAFPTLHRVASQGYGVVVRYPGKLKPEYEGFQQEQFKELRAANTEIRLPAREVCELVYTGDTVFSELLKPELNFLFEAEVLIMECTYMDGEPEKALKYAHVHVHDIVSSADRFKNKTLFLVHISRKYTSDFILQCLRSTLPKNLQIITSVNLKLQGRREHMTRVSDSEHEKRLRDEPGWGWGGGKVKTVNRQRSQGRGGGGGASGAGRGTTPKRWESDRGQPHGRSIFTADKKGSS